MKREIGEQGTVQLNSGRWNWTALTAPGGHVLMLRHDKHPRDEMKTWIDDADGEEIREAARQPVYRAWEDLDGALWIVSVDFASLQKDSHLWLNFRNSLRERSAYAPSELALGELTSQELASYLKEAT